MEFKDYYQVLGLDKSASEDEIKKSYRKLARKYHPDVSKEADAELRMKEVNEAYAVLGDLEKRAAYDQLGGGYRDGQQFQPPPNWDAGFEFSGADFSGADMGDFSDFFANLFGHAAAGRAGRGGRAGPRPRRGEDHHAKIVIDLRDAYQGAPRTITLRGARADAQGRVSMQEHNLTVQIPKGVKEGQHIRLAGQGSPGSDGSAAGDLFLEVHFKQDPHYRVDGRDVYETLPVTPWEAALGASIEAPTPSGKVQVKIPANSQGGRKLRLKGRGIPGEPAGDLYLLLEIVLPPADSEKARQLYEMMAREMAFNPRLAMGV
ncbi:DnaJ C-terminal domain-containing protein [Pseudomonas sp. SA3-5]|uniref:DnaJ C-terminal domain-containing protein n=1 Tax=Pseudomonas aestuarii TaxID=3018340 RepID=A0ABT4XI05_9PSED|nr:DnaJ C-terminal domain-containing protein [Pseudomonas aestuarii]MDA7087859.1 DnaJ C-terminal domain-containing protein [Pseudomonas aestuarii]